jgi:nicotinamide-nucleotide amidase
MPTTVNAEIIAIGTELLLGEITDTNSVFIARCLRDIGVNLYYMTSVGDNEQRIISAIQIALSRADLVITCGGLGPTVDDMTRQAVAAATDRGLRFHQFLLDAIAERFASFHAQMTTNNHQQAYLPDDAIVIENPVGTAPSFIVEHKGKYVISLPGVPREMKFLMAEKVVPFLKTQYTLGTSIIKARILHSAGIGESLLDAQIGKELLQQSNPTVGLAAHAGQVDIRITAKADSESEADEMIRSVEDKIRDRVGQHIYGVDGIKIEDVLVQLLIDHNTKLSIVEAGLKEPVSRRIFDVSNGTSVLSQIYEFESPDKLKSDLGLEPSLNIRETAELAARIACERSASTAGIAVVCIPYIDELHSDSEGGIALAVYTPEKLRSRVYGFGGQADIAPQWAATWSMSMLWQLLTEKFGTIS